MKQQRRRDQVHDGRVHVSVWGTRPSIEREIKKASGISRTVVYCGAALSCRHPVAGVVDKEPFLSIVPLSCPRFEDGA